MSGKRKDRPKTVGDFWTSSEDRKSRQTFREEYSNNEDDEVLKTLSMAADLGKSFHFGMSFFKLLLSLIRQRVRKLLT